MKVLLIETAPGAAAPLAGQLVDDGHIVVSCNDDHGGPCRGVSDHVDCPLQSHVDLAIVARSEGAAATLNEMGSVCASQRRVPIVEVDPTLADDEMPSVEVAGALATRKVEAAYAAAVKHEFPHVDMHVDVQRRPGRVHVVLDVAEAGLTPSAVSSMADRARHAVRTFDPFVSGIDVSVATGGERRD